ncbi:hypothetical protein VS868_12620 [Salinimicrobium sp. 3283s]|uniref:hypothetical protein n=1 Tax=Salinimicrobium sp. 3283s TaxID=3114359 RepID=UPI0031E58382
MNKKKPKILAVLVNYGTEQIQYLEQVIKELKSFSKYDVTVIVNSNIDLNIKGIDKVEIFKLDDYQLLPLTCRNTIWNNKQFYDIFLYGENDLLFEEKHIDNHLIYSSFLPKNRIAGLLRYEEDADGKYYPDYHANFEWDFNSVEIYGGKKFAHFTNLHQATFILTKEQLQDLGKKIKFNQLYTDSFSGYIELTKRKISQKLGIKIKRTTLYSEIYSKKCRVNTDIFKYGGKKKIICITDFDQNLIHHLSNVYINGLKGRNKLRSDEARMRNSIKKLLK